MITPKKEKAQACEVVSKEDLPQIIPKNVVDLNKLSMVPHMFQSPSMKSKVLLKSSLLLRQ